MDKLTMQVKNMSNNTQVIITQDGVLIMKGKVCVSDVEDLRKMIMEESHCLAYVIHPSSTKLYQTIKKNYW